MVVALGLHGAPGAMRRLRIRASDVSFSLAQPADTMILNSLPARILSISGQDQGGAQVNVVARLGLDGLGARIAARITRKSSDRLNLSAGSAVYAQIKSVALLASGANARDKGGAP